jgi:YfiH family protein
MSGGDAPEAVRENRARAARAIGADPARLVGLHQVHGAAVARVREPWRVSEGLRADAMVTDRPEIALGIVTADCAPVLFGDPAAGVIAAAHAGWRGAVEGVLEATVDAMAALGAARPGITAAIGPCIGQSSYEVAADLRAAVLARGLSDERFFQPAERPGRWQFDLASYCAARLVACGIGRVDTLGLDTLLDEARFFSHRRRTLAGGGAIGHQISIVALAA